MKKAQLMIRNFEDKSYVGNGSYEFLKIPNKGEYICINDKFYIVERVVYDLQSGVDLYLVYTTVKSMESLIGS